MHRSTFLDHGTSQRWLLSGSLRLFHKKTVKGIYSLFASTEIFNNNNNNNNNQDVWRYQPASSLHNLFPRGF
jgi:hypothetical protein